MKKRLLQIAMVLCCTLLLAASAAAHCEIPCGIYDDEARIGMLLEHVATIEKSMNQILRKTRITTPTSWSAG
jgi:nickel superoxide dismutase